MQREKKYSVLLVDDELLNIKVLSDILKDDYEVIFATAAEEGIFRAIESRPDIILLDIMMPGIDGYEVCARLQSDTRTAKIPIIFVTALGSAAHEVKGLDSGAVDYVTKPINGEIVKARIRNHLRFKSVFLASSVPEQPVDRAMASMSERQREIFEWVKQGKTNWEIAKIIACSEENVKYHMKSILRILGSHNRTQAVASHPQQKPSDPS